MLYDHLNVGDRVTWEAINRDYTGTVEKVDDRGVLVAIDGGGHMILSTARSMKAAEEDRKRRQEELQKRRDNPNFISPAKGRGAVQVRE